MCARQTYLRYQWTPVSRTARAGAGDLDPAGGAGHPEALGAVEQPAAGTGRRGAGSSRRSAARAGAVANGGAPPARRSGGAAAAAGVSRRGPRPRRWLRRCPARYVSTARSSALLRVVHVDRRCVRGAGYPSFVSTKGRRRGHDGRMRTSTNTGARRTARAALAVMALTLAAACGSGGDGDGRGGDEGAEDGDRQPGAARARRSASRTSRRTRTSCGRPSAPPATASTSSPPSPPTAASASGSTRPRTTAARTSSAASGSPSATQKVVTALRGRLGGTVEAGAQHHRGRRGRQPREQRGPRAHRAPRDADRAGHGDGRSRRRNGPPPGGRSPVRVQRITGTSGRC